MAESVERRTDNTDRPQIITITSRMFAINTYIVYLPGRTDCIVVDPGFDTSRIIDKLFELRLTPAAILNTHGHVDHIFGNAALKKEWPRCPLVIGADEEDKLTDPYKNLSGLYGTPVVSPPADTLVHHGETYSAAGLDFLTLSAPGHSSGHVVFVWRGESPWFVLGGDVLFQGSVGRTDFPDGDFDQLREAIHSHLFPLPADTIVYPGHGGATTIGIERRSNPYVGLDA
ncbi:MAG: MBL fold metallo-hydrolase [Pirellulales bacterium]